MEKKKINTLKYVFMATKYDLMWVRVILSGYRYDKSKANETKHNKNTTDGRRYKRYSSFYC